MFPRLWALSGFIFLALSAIADAGRVQITDPRIELGKAPRVNNASKYLPIVMWHGKRV